MDRTRRKRLFLFAAFWAYAVALATGGLFLSRDLVGPAAASLFVAGACGPLLTGGLSSMLASLVTDRESAQRRAQGMDAFTYGVAATVGPALVAIVASSADTVAAVLTAGALAIVAGLVLFALPAGARYGGPEASALTVREALALLVRIGPLRRVAVAATLAALPIGALSLLAVVFALDHGGRAVQGALLVAAYGLGGLVGSALCVLRPLRGDPERLALRWTIAIGGGLALCAVAPTILIAAATFCIVGVVGSIQFAATLAARSAFSPPPARAQLFVTTAGLKVAFSSLGVALVGAASGADSVWLLAAGSLIALAGVAYMVIDGRRREAVSP
jgi:hypothetical protein